MDDKPNQIESHGSIWILKLFSQNQFIFLILVYKLIGSVLNRFFTKKIVLNQFL